MLCFFFVRNLPYPLSYPLQILQTVFSAAYLIVRAGVRKQIKKLHFSIDSDERAPRNTVKSRIFCRRLRKMWGFVRFSLVFCTVTRRNCSSLQPFFVRRSATNPPHKNGRGTPPLPLCYTVPRRVLFAPPFVCYIRFKNRKRLRVRFVKYVIYYFFTLFAVLFAAPFELF